MCHGFQSIILHILPQHGIHPACDEVEAKSLQKVTSVATKGKTRKNEEKTRDWGSGRERHMCHGFQSIILHILPQHGIHPACDEVEAKSLQKVTAVAILVLSPLAMITKARQTVVMKAKSHWTAKWTNNSLTRNKYRGR